MNNVVRREKNFSHPCQGTFYGFIFLMFAGSCTTAKNVAYFQGLTDTSKIYTQAIKTTYEAQIRPDDILEIVINNINPEAAAPFNLGNTNPGLIPASHNITSNGTLPEEDELDFYAAPVYKITSKILIKDDKSRLVSSGSSDNFAKRARRYMQYKK